MVCACQNNIYLNDHDASVIFTFKSRNKCKYLLLTDTLFYLAYLSQCLLDHPNITKLSRMVVILVNCFKWL